MRRRPRRTRPPPPSPANGTMTIAVVTATRTAPSTVRGSRGASGNGFSALVVHGELISHGGRYLLRHCPEMQEKHGQRPGRENTRGDASGLRWIGSLVVGPPYKSRVSIGRGFRSSAGISFVPVMSRA